MQPRPSGSKSRPTARKRPNADDSPFIGPSAGAKRGAEKQDGGMERAKRKRAEAHASVSIGKRSERLGEGDVASFCVDFHALPAESLHRYLCLADAVPVIYPSPCFTDNPPLPTSLLDPHATALRITSPAPSTTTASRSKRDSKEGHRRRSSRLQEEDARNRRAPILADAEAVHDVLATLAERHLAKQVIKENDVVQQFLLAVKARC